MPGLLNPFMLFAAGGGGLGPYVPTGQTLGAHRYWRVNMTTNHGGGFLAVAEMELRTSFGGADETGSGTAIASSATDGAAADAFDNNGSTFWANNTSSAWLGYDFGIGVTKDIREVSMTMPSFATSNTPKDFTIDWSDDGSAWTAVLAASVSVVDWGGASGTKLFAIPVVSYRINITADVSTGNPAVATFAIAQTSGGADETQLGNGHATGTVENSDLSEKGFDNNTSTSWQSSGTDVGSLAYHFGTAVNFAEAKITVGASNSSNPKTFTFDVSEDGGQTWTPILSPPDEPTWVANTPKTFTR